jgi:hypothetical protein
LVASSPAPMVAAATAIFKDIDLSNTSAIASSGVKSDQAA